MIESFNDDKPYDQFVKEHLAGDAMGADIGTGFLVAGPYDIVKSPDPNLTLMQRQDELADMINTTGTAFLGMTIGCARCHDHKFDPLTAKEYYHLVSTFGQTIRSEIDVSAGAVGHEEALGKWEKTKKDAMLIFVGQMLGLLVNSSAS